MPKFFVKTNQINEDEIIILNEDVNHIKNVLRANINDIINVCNSEDSKNYKCRIHRLENDKIVCKIEEQIKSEVEGRVNLTIYQGLPKSDKMELIIQKATELGVSEITPLKMDRCVAVLDGKSEEKKIERWQKIAEVAAKQSGRDIIPKINNVLSIKKLCDLVKEYNIVLLAYENEKDNSIKSELVKLKQLCKDSDKINIAVIIGPEGGIANGEVDLLKNAGAKVVSLGNRILRTETVALNVASIIMYELEG